MCVFVHVICNVDNGEIGKVLHHIPKSCYVQGLLLQAISHQEKYGFVVWERIWGEGYVKQRRWSQYFAKANPFLSKDYQTKFQVP